MSANFKFKTIFGCKLTPLVSAEKDKYLAIASLKEIRAFLPDIDIDRNIDLLPVAFNAFVANRVNKNDDVINTATAINIANLFINKQINVEHNRSRIVGVILSAGFSEFGTDKVITLEEASKMTSPFNVVLGAVIWRIVNKSLADVIEESNDPDSEFYQKVSASWELGFSEFDLIVLDDGKKNVEDGQIISDSTEIASLEANLLAVGGTGKLPNGKRLYRMAKGNVLPLGIGLTESPAADVVGVAVNINTESTSTEDINKNQISQNFISQIEQSNVKNGSIMDKLTKVEDVTDEFLKTANASVVIRNFITEELKKCSEDFAAKKTEKEVALAEAQKKFTSISTDYETVKAQMETIKAELDKIKSEAAAKEVLEKFNDRMASWDEKFNLSEEDRAIIASSVKTLSDSEYDVFAKNMSVLLKEKSKANKPAESKASVADDKKTVEAALDNAKTELTKVPATISSEQSMKSKYAKAFSKEGFEVISYKR